MRYKYQKGVEHTDHKWHICSHESSLLIQTPTANSSNLSRPSASLWAQYTVSWYSVGLMVADTLQSCGQSWIKRVFALKGTLAYIFVCVCVWIMHDEAARWQLLGPARCIRSGCLMVSASENGPLSGASWLRRLLFSFRSDSLQLCSIHPLVLTRSCQGHVVEQTRKQCVSCERWPALKPLIYYQILHWAQGGLIKPNAGTNDEACKHNNVPSLMNVLCTLQIPLTVPAIRCSTVSQKAAIHCVRCLNVEERWISFLKALFNTSD